MVTAAQNAIMLANASQAWEGERIYFSGDEFFDAIEASLGRAERSIDAEFYIFAVDRLGERIAQALLQAARRGVAVRLLLDGIGSPHWEEHFGSRFRAAGVRYRVFHRPPWDWWRRRRDPGPRLLSLRAWMVRLNTRNHRKLVVVDGSRAFLGGMNVSEVHLASVVGDRAWRDTSVCVEGAGVASLAQSTEILWGGLRGRAARLLRRKAQSQHPLVLVNSFRSQRLKNYRALLNRIDREQERLWITSAYFVPPRSLMKAISRACRRGVDVRVVVPGRSDVFFMPWVHSAFCHALFVSGARVFEYQPAVLHAKTIQGGAWAIVGSSNMNHRSVLHDLEVDVVLTKSESLDGLAKQFVADEALSREFSPHELLKRPLWVRLVAHIMLALRYFL